MTILELAIRLALTFFTLLALARIMGRKEISQMTFFNFISAITIGNIAGSLATRNEFSIQNGVLALLGWTGFTLLMGYIDLHSKKLRKVIEGEPVVVIKEGQILENALKKVRLNMDELKVLLRQNKVFSLNEINYAILETDGKLSVMKKEDKQNLTRSDLSIQNATPPVYPFPTEVISDGKINETNLSKLNLNSNWLQQQLDDLGIESSSDVFYAEVQQDGSLIVDKRNDTLH